MGEVDVCVFTTFRRGYVPRSNVQHKVVIFNTGKSTNEYEFSFVDYFDKNSQIYQEIYK